MEMISQAAMMWFSFCKFYNSMRRDVPSPLIQTAGSLGSVKQWAGNRWENDHFKERREICLATVTQQKNREENKKRCRFGPFARKRFSREEPLGKGYFSSQTPHLRISVSGVIISRQTLTYS